MSADTFLRFLVAAILTVIALGAMLAEPPKVGMGPIVCDCRTGKCVAGTPQCTCLCAYEDEAAVQYDRPDAL